MIGQHASAVTNFYAAPKMICRCQTGCEVYNLGTGKGTSVLEIVRAFEKASGKISQMNASPSFLPHSDFRLSILTLCGHDYLFLNDRTLAIVMGMLTGLCLWKKEVVDIIKIHAPSLEPKGMDDDAGPQIRKFYAEVSQTLFLISMFKLQECALDFSVNDFNAIQKPIVLVAQLARIGFDESG
ncbi:hypothetical protein K1719_047031 [Acacia pycnantha]|nr:hypothetical protein K1719_047031 [Acacia pycnantha]